MQEPSQPREVQGLRLYSADCLHQHNRYALQHPLLCEEGRILPNLGRTVQESEPADLGDYSWRQDMGCYCGGDT